MRICHLRWMMYAIQIRCVPKYIYKDKACLYNNFLFLFEQKDDMEVEHLATLERLRQSQRQDYLKVRHTP